ncbi:hypothetical protein ACI0FM_11830 [Paenochrobactrum sp. BZR 588]|uniref:hypothetical protein n=1 Tax=Paenochrobactrum TaxID=999488 RepID=UPI0035BC1149
MANSRLPQSENEKKRDNALFLLPLFGAVFSLPPMMNLFNHKVLIFGMPLAFLYLLGVWTIMVIMAFIISRKRSKIIAPAHDASPQIPPAKTSPTPVLTSDESRL